MLGQISSTWRLAARARPKPYHNEILPRIFPPCNLSRTFNDSHASLQWQLKKPTFTPSNDQQKIAKLCRTKNVVVSARPGSGKTATAEAIIAAHPGLRVLVLTYSKRLQLETLRRLQPYPNCEVYTFHSMAGRLFGTEVSNDAILSKLTREALDRNELPKWKYEPFDIIVLDEFQDCTESLFWLTICFIRAIQKEVGGKPARLVVLGDERQAIYGFRGADDRYLTLAPELFGPVSPYPFAKVPLRQSFRLSEQSVRFINEVFLGGKSCITSNKTGPKPIIIKCASFESFALARKLWPLIKHHGAENTAILSPSVRQHGTKQGPLQRVVNTLSKKYGVPTHVPPNEEVSLNDKVIDGKMCVSTIHQFKGNERDLIVAFGIDASYFKNFGRHLPDDRCPNEIFVALTRAKEQLVLIHHEDKKLMPFASVKALYETADVTDMTKAQREIKAPDVPGRPAKHGLALPQTVAVRDMVRHVKDESLEKVIQKYLHIRKLPPLPEDEHIKLCNIVSSDEQLNFYEDVSDLNGLVVVAAFEHQVSGTLDTLDLDPDDIEGMPVMHSQHGVSWLCRQACKYEAKVSGYDPRKIQMKYHDFDWIKPADLALARSRLWGQFRDSIGNLRFETEAHEQFRVNIEGDAEDCCLLGRADIVAVSSPDRKMSDAVWEIKFVSQLSSQHACAMLYNLRTGEKWEITPRDGLQGLQKLIQDVLKLKYTTERKMSDEEFIGKCSKERLEVMNLE
ncbi:DNA helicase [Fusarium sp. LHS14.1]|nr:DNA helicase [Fusarium sp. LHS14.1]